MEAAILAWLLLATHLCSDPSEAHELGPADHGGAGTHDHGDAGSSQQGPDVDCHSVALVNHDREAFAVQGDAHSFGPLLAAAAIRKFVDASPVLAATPRVLDASPPPLYLLHAVLLI